MLSLSNQLANLARAVLSTPAAPDEKPKKSLPASEAARANREKILHWLRTEGKKSAREISEKFDFLYTTTHSYLQRLVTDGEITLINATDRRLFAAKPDPAGDTMKNTGFVPVPETTLPGGRIVPAFQIAQFACSQKDGALDISAEGTPWVRIDYHNAVKACASAGAQLTHESQWLALAYHIAAQDENWTGGKVGQGKLFQGLRKLSARSAQPAHIEPKDPDERRWFALPGGHRIYDIAGNVFEWVFDDVQGDASGLIASAFTANSPSLVIPYPTEDKGQGWTPDVGCDGSGYALVRGGCWVSDSHAGAFRLDRGWPGGESGVVGFRCTKPCL